MISYGSHWIDDEDVDAVVEALRGDRITQGEITPKFEKAIASYINVPEVVAVNSATSALHIACLALGVKAGSKVWVPAISFVATSNCAKYCGADIEFVDVESNTGRMCLDILEDNLIKAKKSNVLPDLVVVVDFAGHPVDIERLKNLKNNYGFYLISDSSHAFGAQYASGMRVGADKAVDITVFSFHPVKMITSVEGGVAVTNDVEVAGRMRLFRDHGIERKFQSSVPGWYYEQCLLGFNYRMSDVHAALGLSQLLKLSRFIDVRTKLAENYIRFFEDVDWAEPVTPLIDSRSSWHLFVVCLSEGVCKYRDELFKFLVNNGVGVQVHYIPIYHHPYYRSQLGDLFSLENAENYFNSALTIPLHCKIRKQEQDFVLNMLQQGVKEVCELEK